MSKKSAFTCFILCIAIILSLAFSACGSTKVDNTTGPSSSTEATNNTTSASEPAETTSNSTASTPLETTETTTQALWQPNFDEPWNFNPTFTRGGFDFDYNDYDMEIILDQTVYEEAPDSISVKIVNRTGKKSIWMCIGAFLEDLYLDPTYEGLEGRVNAYMWVRLPYYVGMSWGEMWVSEMTYTIDLTKNGSHWQAPYEFKPGKYRIVFFFPDGPHYAYFEITGSSS